MKFNFFILFLIIFSFGSCDKGQTIEDSIPASDLSNSFSSGCLPSNINLLYSIDGSDTIKIYRTGFWHNQLLDKYATTGVYPQVQCGYANVRFADSMTHIFADSYFSETDIGDYLEMVTLYDSTHIVNLNFSCDSNAIIVEGIIDDLIDQYDTLSLMNSNERAIIIQALNYAQSGGFASMQQKEDLIDDWSDVSGKFLDGVISGGIIAILIYSDCYWQHYASTSSELITASTRLPPVWLMMDVAGGAASFITRAVKGELNGTNNDPGAGLEHLKNAGKDAVRASLGRWGMALVWW